MRELCQCRHVREPWKLGDSREEEIQGSLIGAAVDYTLRLLHLFEMYMGGQTAILSSAPTRLLSLTSLGEGRLDLEFWGWRGNVTAL